MEWGTELFAMTFIERTISMNEWFLMFSCVGGESGETWASPPGMVSEWMQTGN
jgi:hypothetical protein